MYQIYNPSFTGEYSAGPSVSEEPRAAKVGW